MFLRSIEIQGFKSFPDKVSMDFDKGVSAIVGPNGSGKSNIVDAIRWVLGEQSTKTLRGGKMEDVIFGGTLKRRPVSFCQVTLILDNSDGRLPLEYAEVSVTRRYYRSGESEFFLNRKAVRLKDIHELFMDTGLGRDGYSIIGQGRIDEILSVKSADRREIFEEAAGITRFRYRKEESQRRLAGCEDNLTRIRDIITELEYQVGPLKEQSDKARSFLRLRDELRVLEVSAWMDTLDKIKDNLRAAQVDFDNAQRKLSAIRSEQEDMQEQSQEITAQMQQKDVETEALRRQLETLVQQISGVQSEIAVAKSTYGINESNIEGKRRELEAQVDRGHGLSAQLEAKQQALTNLRLREEELAKDLEELMRRVEDSAAQAKDIEGKLDALEAGIQLKRQQAADIGSQKASLEASIAEVKSRGAGIEDEYASASQRLQRETLRAEEIAASVTENREKRQSAENMLKGFALRRESRQKKRDELADKAGKLARQKDSKADRLGILEAMEREYEGFSGAVRKVMQAAIRRELTGIHGPVSDIIATDEEYSLAIEIALGAGLQNIVVDSEQDSKAAINYLKKNDLGRATFLPLSAVKDRNQGRKGIDFGQGFIGWGDKLVRCDGKYTRLVSSLLGGTAVYDNLDSAIAASKRHGYSFRIVTLDGQIITTSGAMTGGSAGRGTGVLSRAGEIRRLHQEIAALRGQAEEADKALREAVRDLEAATYESGVAEAELRQAEDALLALNAEQTQHGALIEALKGSLEGLEREKSGQSGRLEELERAVAGTAAQLDELRVQEQELVSRREALAGGRREAELHSGSLAAQVSAVREEIAAVRAEIDSNLSAIGDFRRLLDSMDEEKGGKEDDIARLLLANRELLEAVSAKEAAAQALELEASALREGIRGLGAQRMELEGARARCEREIQARNNDIINMERESSRLENKKTQVEMEEDSIIQRMWESYELTRDTARQVRIELESPGKSGRRIAELKTEIKKLGDVNISAIEEYAKVNQRYEFLSTQRDDLEKAKADLLKIIAELTENMKTIFATEFQKINQMFQATFAEIFGGGSGYLQLEDEDDILNCGIEIKVELPGKSMRVISLLSGGEKAFVAIALYFAIIKVRPTPFCVLDEIDAALDNVNVVRFSDYMRTLSGGTQFIVITHRRGTMEGADILYGATMQEKGVTKLLTLNISQVEKEIRLKPN